MDHKTCSDCKAEKPLSAFSASAVYKDGYRGQCKSCRISYQNRYRVTEAGRACERRRAKKARASGARLDYDRQRKYGLDKETYESLFAKQGMCCAICKSSHAKNKFNTFHVDHCHKTGAVRGILCHRCNQTLSRVGDDLPGIMRFVDYLKEPPASLNDDQWESLGDAVAQIVHRLVERRHDA